jgi:phosphoenolpyruvate carboxykinase (GTP)
VDARLRIPTLASQLPRVSARLSRKVGQLRRDPMAMLPFCGYNMGDYFGHYLKVGQKSGAKLPKIYYVNWFRTDENGKFMWPGYGENSRILKWIFERVSGTGHAVDTPIGRMPEPKDIDTNGLDVTPAQMQKLLDVDVDGWMAELPLIREHFAKFGSHLPKGMTEEVDRLEDRLKKAKK